jgi:hypothetical protein
VVQVFAAGYHHPDVKAPCSDKLFEDDDCALSPNSVFELAFCVGNVFRNNAASQSIFAFWLSCFWKNTIEVNTISSTRNAPDRNRARAGLAHRGQHGKSCGEANANPACGREGVGARISPGGFRGTAI